MLLFAVVLGYAPRGLPHVRPDARRRASPPQCSLAEAIERSLISKFGREEISRVLSSWRSMGEGYVHNVSLPGFDEEPMLRQQANSYIEGLPLHIFHDEQEHAWVRELERQAATVADEFKGILQGGDLERRANNPWTGLSDIRDESTVAYGPEWRTLGLQDRGVWDEVNTKVFPKTTAVLRESGVPCVEAFFAKMQAGSSIQAHSDG